MDVAIPCICPPKADGEPRHAGDTVVLRDTFPPRARRALIYDLSLNDEGTMGDRLALLNEGYVIRGVESWTLVDAKDKPLEVTPKAIAEHLIDRENVYDIVAKAADDLYTEAVLLPLLLGASSFSPPTPTVARMSAATNGRTPRKPSKRSSTITFPTAGTEPTLLSNGGVSSSSAR